MSKTRTVLLDIGQGLFTLLSTPSIASWTTANRPKNAKSGTLGYNTETHNLEYWDGSSWFKALMGKT